MPPGPDAFKRYTIFALVGLASLLSIIASVVYGPALYAVAAIFTGLFALGIYDLVQRRHAILRNYPIIGHLRYLFEGFRPEIRQYMIEGDRDEVPFSRDARALVYQRAKGVEDKRPFGTIENVYSGGYSWLTHSAVPTKIADADFRVRIGGPDCRKPYDIALMNISSMSFGSLSKNAVQAMNKGAAMGGFVHATGEGGLTKYHLEHGADVFWEIGSGYFGCRDEHGKFAPETFRTKVATEQVKAVTIKLSQGAKPGIGGVLPMAKITPEIAEARGVPMDRDCVSPASHSAFHTPRELMEFVGKLRELAEGKPIGYKFCVGSRTDVLAMCKAMLDTGITPDYIIIDGSEGGTGAAPLEYEDHIGTPLTEGLRLTYDHYLQEVAR